MTIWANKFKLISHKMDFQVQMNHSWVKQWGPGLLMALLAAVLGVVSCRLLKLPPMLGYLCVGVVIGPNALALSKNVEAVQHLGEFGVV